MPEPLDGLSQSPEALIAKTFFGILKADSLLVSVFKPILLIESPTREAFDELTIYTMAVVPWRVRLTDHPGGRQTSFLDLIVSGYLPKEGTEQDSRLRGLDLGSHVRKLAYSNMGLVDTIADPDRVITFAVIDFAYLVSLEPRDTGIRILSFQITFQTDIAPETGAFI
jgi:hypothetical protein